MTSPNTTRRAQPPRLAQWLAAWRVPAAHREFVLGDLNEEFQRFAAARGERAARRWFWHQAWRGAATGYAVTPQVPDARRGASMSALIQDVRYAFRNFHRTPGSTAVVVLTLAIGIGATTAIFSIADALVLRPLPYPQPEQLVRLAMREPDSSLVSRTTYEDVLRWQSLSHVFSHVGAIEGLTSRLLGDAEVESMTIMKVSPDYLRLYGVAPALGRFFTADDARPGAPPVMILGHDYWRSRLNGDRSVIGRDLRFLDGSATVVGVAPRTIDVQTDSWVPLVTPADPVALRVGANARLRPGITLEIAEKALIDQAKALQDPQAGDANAVPLVSPISGRTSSTVRRTVAVLTGAVAFVLLIACANVAGLQFARGAARRHELTIRTALGAARLRLIRQLLTETVLIALVGGVAGAGLAWLVLDALVAILPVSLRSVPRPIEINPVVLTATMVLSMGIGLSVGLLPALWLSQVNPSATLGSARVGHGPTLSKRGGRVLIAVEVGLALVLLAGSALMIRSVGRLHAVDLGFRPENYLTLEVRPLDQSAPTREWFYPALLERIRTLPGVGAAGAIRSRSRVVERMGPVGGPIVAPPRNLANRTVLPGYFEAAGIRLLAGRFPTERDRTAPIPALVMSESVAKHLFGASSAVGRRVEIDIGEPLLNEVIGVVSDLLRGGPRAAAQPELYPVFRDHDPIGVPTTIIARPQGSASALATQLRAAAQSLGPRVRAPTITIGDPRFVDSIAQDRQRTLLLGVLGSLGLALALVGILATTAYSVARRTSEIGVRMAMGAAPGQVVREIVRDAAWPILIGLVIGLAGAFLSTRAIASYLFETTPHDPVALAGATMILGLVGCLAAWLPARKAAFVDPVTTLRSE